MWTYNAGATSIFRKISILVCGSETVALDISKCATAPTLSYVYNIDSSETGYVKT
jgi:hypothetical protein